VGSGVVRIGYWTFRGHANSWTDDSRIGQFADTTFRGNDNLRTRRFTDMPIRGLWTIRRKTFRRQAGLFANKLFGVTTLPVASSRAEIVKS